jgi:hypothetical protein
MSYLECGKALDRWTGPRYLVLAFWLCGLGLLQEFGAKLFLP